MLIHDLRIYLRLIPKFGADNNISDLMLAEIFLAKYPIYSCQIKKPNNYINKKSCGCC